MRFYNLVLSDPVTGKTYKYYSSLTDQGNPNPSALNIEFDGYVYAHDVVDPNSWVRVWGVPITDIRDAKGFNGMILTLYGGMSKGLPLATPAQQGIIYKGTVFQTVGNWQGTVMNIEFYLIPFVQRIANGNQKPQTPNIVVNWIKGQTLASALMVTLGAAFPTMNQDIQISPNLVLGYSEQAYFQNMAQLASWVSQISASIINSESYHGVKIVSQRGTFTVRDGTVVSSKPTPIVFNDLIGQITLGDPGTINMNCVLRGDLSAMELISIPPGQVTTTSASYAAFRQNPTFSGNYLIQSLRHVGNLRQTDAMSWITVVDAVGPIQGQATA